MKQTAKFLWVDLVGVLCETHRVGKDQKTPSLGVHLAIEERSNFTDLELASV